MKLGFFDSGWGGLSILKAVVACYPSLDCVYVADAAHVPYHTKTPSFILERARQITAWLIANQATTIVIACNSATTVAIAALRREFPQVSFIGTEPALKPAAGDKAVSKNIAILATAATLGSHRFGQLVSKYAKQQTITTTSFPAWVRLVEKGEVESELAVGQVVSDVGALGRLDAIVLACTHYIFFEPVIQKFFPKVVIFDPIEGITRRIRNLVHLSWQTSKSSDVRVVSTAEDSSSQIASRLLGQSLTVECVHI